MKLPFFSSKQIDGENGLKLIDQKAYESADKLANELSTKGLTVSIEPAYELGEPPVLAGGSDQDAVNAQKLHEWFSAAKPKIPRTVLADGRLWAALCHKTFAEYMIGRWGPKVKASEESNDSRLNSRFFANGEGQRNLVRNGLARLYFSAEIVLQDGNYNLLQIFFEKQDIHQSFIERTLAGDSGLIRSVAQNCLNVKGLKTKEEKLNKLNIQNYAKLVNGAGGTRSLDKVSEMGIKVLTEAAFGTDADNKTDGQD
jgi:hypothetical protein